MSRERRPPVPAVFVMESGETFVEDLEHEKLPLGLGKLPKVGRLLDVYCPRGHLLAVLMPAPQTTALAVIIQGGGSGPLPVWLVTTRGLAPVAGELLPEGEVSLHLLLDPQPSAEVRCLGCRRGAYPVHYTELMTQLGRPWRARRAWHLGASQADSRAHE